MHAFLTHNSLKAGLAEHGAGILIHARAVSALVAGSILADTAEAARAMCVCPSLLASAAVFSYQGVSGAMRGLDRREHGVMVHEALLQRVTETFAAK